MSTRRIVPVLVVLATFAAACSSTASKDSSVSEPESSAAVESSSGEAIETGETETTPPTTPEFTGTRVDPFTVDQIPGDPASDVPSALDNMNDDEFPEPLIDPDKVLSGGPPPDGIPPLDSPKFEPVEQVDWLQPNEPVLVLKLDGETRAYPIQIMTWHEIVNDTFGDTPVTISYCPLCNSAVAYDRRIEGGATLDFGTSGRLFNSSLVMYDRQTESLWSHFTATAVIGSLTGVELDTYPVTTIGFGAFAEANPEALVLSQDTGFSRNYGRNPYPGYDDVGTSPFLFDGDLDGRLPPQSRVVVVRNSESAVAILQEKLISDRVVTSELNGEPLVMFGQTGTSSALDSVQIANGDDVGATGVFSPVLNGEILTFTSATDGVFVDEQTGSTWNIFGEALSGELQGSTLDAVAHLNTFWFAIAAFNPTVILQDS